MTRKNSGFALIEVVMSFFLISLLGTMILLVYSMTISKYDDKRSERKAYILVNNIHQEFLSSPEKFYLVENEIKNNAGIYYYDEFLRECRLGERFVYKVFYSVLVSSDISYASLYIAHVEYKNKEIIKDVTLGKMRITS